MKKALLILFFLQMLQYAQTKSDITSFIENQPKMNSFLSRFDKQLSTYSLLNGLTYNQEIKTLSFSLSENFNSTLVRSTTNNVKDEHFFSFKSSYGFSSEFNLGINANNTILSDNRSLEINSASASNLILFGNYIPETGFDIVPYFGYSKDRQIGQSDYGYIYGLESKANYIATTDFFVNSSLRFKNEDINPRKNFQRYLNVELKNVFTDRVQNLFSALYSSNRKDFYYAADSITAASFKIKNNIQSRIETNYNMQDRFSYAGFLEIFKLDFGTNISWRNIDRDTRYQTVNILTSSNYDYKITELKMEFEQNTSFNLGWFDGRFRGYYAERDEKHIAKNPSSLSRVFIEQHNSTESQKNNSSVQGSLSFTGSFKLSDKDTLLFSLFHNKLSYDTPDSLNYDDRDELYSIIRIRYSRQFNPFFLFFVNAETDINHVVYIFSERSSNNNINRVIRLSAGGLYSGKSFSSLNSFEVSANYTVYDFEELNANLTSFSFRQYSINDSTTVKLTNRLSFATFCSVKLSEQGNFRWNSFSTQPVQYMREIYFEPRFVTQIRKTFFSLGLRYFSLCTYRYNKLDKTLDTKYISAGPSAEILANLPNKFILNIKGYYEYISTNNNANRQIPNINCEVMWNF